MINLKDIKSAKHISDPTEEKLNDLKLVSQETNKDIVSTQGENTKDILRARSIERLDALDIDSATFNSKIGERETSVSEELSEITNSTEKVISDSEKYTEDIEAFLSVAKGDDFLFFLDDCTRAVGRLDKLTNGSYLCYGKKITSWDIPLPVLENGGNDQLGMFSECVSLTSFNSDLSVLTNGESMFRHCRSLMSWNIDLPELENGNWMFYGCYNLTSFKSKLPKLKYAAGPYTYGMFCACSLTSWDIPLPSLVNGDGMFRSCSKLASVKTVLPLLTNGFCMFENTKISSWDIPLPSLVDGRSMFGGVKLLPIFNVDLPALTIGRYMFYNCESLTRFKGYLPSLIYGDDMFYGCKLNLASVQNIAEGINDLTVQSKTGKITIGIDASLRYNDALTDEEQPDAVATKNAIVAIVAKGWTVTEQYN